MAKKIQEAEPKVWRVSYKIVASNEDAAWKEAEKCARTGMIEIDSLEEINE